MNLIEILTETAFQAAATGRTYYVTNPHLNSPHLWSVSPFPFADDVQIAVHADGTCSLCCDGHFDQDIPAPADGGPKRQMPRARLLPPRNAEEEAAHQAGDIADSPLDLSDLPRVVG